MKPPKLTPTSTTHHHPWDWRQNLLANYLFVFRRGFLAIQGPIRAGLLAAIGLGWGWLGGSAAFGQVGERVGQGQIPADSAAATESELWQALIEDPRLQAPRSLDSYFPFPPPANLDQWTERKARQQDRLRTVLGLNPEPPRGPLGTVISRPRIMDGYSVAKVRFESLPGFYVTGNLYRPVDGDELEPAADADGAGGARRRPAVLCPHGHWSRGRLMYASDEEVQRELAAGAESFECGARSPLQARCVHLARMGCVVFHYDMLGNADSVQIPASIAHGFARQRPHLNAPQAWGLFSVRAESYFQSVMGLQTWNTIRSLDFLETLADVDPTRIAVTGASGGGTQTFILGAIDPRPAVVFPAVMVGTAMQGGCVCENCSFLRVETGNVEFAAMFAPKPQGLTAADDWTKEMETKGFPELKSLYELYGAGEQVELTSRLEFGHNYNQVGRQAMYRLVAKQFGLQDFPERPFEVLRDAALAWLAEPAENDSTAEDAVARFEPKTGEAFEIELLQQWRQSSEAVWEEALNRIVATGSDSDEWLLQWRRRMSGIYLGSDYTVPTDLEWQAIQVDVEATLERRQWLLIDRPSRHVVPVVVYSQAADGGEAPHQAEHVCLYFGDAADGILDPSGTLKPWAAERLAAGQRLICVDLIGQGRFVSKAGFTMSQRWQMTQREAAGYVIGYNLPLVSQRAHDVLQVLAKVLPAHPPEPGASDGVNVGVPRGPGRVDVVAEGDGVAALSVSALAWDRWGGSKWQVGEAPSGSPRLRQIELRGGDFRFADVESLRDANFLPGIALIGDLPGLWLLNRVPQVQIDAADSAWQRVNQVRQAVGAPLLHLRP